MVTDRLGNRNFMQPMRRLQGAKFALLSFFWGRGQGGQGCILFPQVPNMFPSGSKNAHQVVNMFHKTFPTTLHLFIPFCLAMLLLPNVLT
jgi:hypothetical protein